MVHNYVCNIVCVGDVDSGKTTLVKSFINDGNHQDNVGQLTVGVEFQTKTVSTLERDVKLLIWDTAGHERFRAVTSNYIKKADIGVIIYDANSKTSFDYATQVWCKQFKEFNPTAQLVLVANNNTSNINVSYEQRKKLQQELGVVFFEIHEIDAPTSKRLFEYCAKDYLTTEQIRHNGDVV